MNKKFKKPPKISPQANIDYDDLDDLKSILLFEDNSCIIFNKPSGIATQGGSGIKLDLDKMLDSWPKRNGNKPKLVHRLDRETSGVILVGKSKSATAFYSAQFAERKVQKIYYALVSGNFESPNGTIDFPLKRGKRNGVDVALIASRKDSMADEAITNYQVLAQNEKFALLKLTPKTGRMHQLRCHLAHIGHPILGDTKYGGLFTIDGNIINRLMLHAYSLEFKLSNLQDKTIIAKIPENFAQFSKNLGFEVSY